MTKSGAMAGNFGHGNRTGMEDVRERGPLFAWPGGPTPFIPMSEYRASKRLKRLRKAAKR